MFLPRPSWHPELRSLRWAPINSEASLLRIVALDVHDVRFPTSRTLDGSDAMNPDPDYSATYTVLRTDSAELAGHALAFTIGRGNELQAAAVSALREHVVGRRAEDICADLGSFQRGL